jgi:Protein of unknown function (DUF1592)/Protein of unknown function (DUF1588)/Protein of unknown function (DUF1585)/Protein of unknown function (DUF1595)
MHRKFFSSVAGRCAYLGFTWALAGCTAELSGGGGGAGTSQPGGGSSSTNPGSDVPPGNATPVTVDGKVVEFAPAGGTFKRLTETELGSSLTALLGTVPVGDLEPDTWLNGFAKIGGGKVSISLSGVEKYQLVIEAATAALFADAKRRDTFVGCTPKGIDDTTCFTQFVTKFGRLAWRRALTPEQITRETKLAGDLSKTFGNATDGLRATTNALLLSPYFLYRLERGEPDSAGKWWRYTGYEMASSLAYFLTNSTPDAALLDAAEKGTLATAEGVRTESQRVLASMPGRNSVGNFSAELFRLAIVAGRAKDQARFPSYTPTMQDAMIREVPAMFQALVFEQSAPATDLFTTHTTYVNSDLAKLYGLDTTGFTPTSWTKVTLPATGLRAGLLGTGAFLSQYANQIEGSPTTRGKFIRTALLCQEIPDPPADVSPVFDETPAGTQQTKRDKLAQHRMKGSTCAGCHNLMDPLGLPLENFDAIGAFRDNDHGLPIDVSGELDGSAFNGPVELGQLLSKSDAVAACMVRNLYRYATGRLEAETEEPVVQQLSTRFGTNKHDFQKLMLDLVTSDGFRYVAAAAP